MYRAILSALVFASPAFAMAPGQTFGGGYKCTIDCSGHRAGYEWAEHKQITDAALCEEILIHAPKRTSFYEGCLTYVKSPGHGAKPDGDK
jgi:hypothetical protein